MGWYAVVEALEVQRRSWKEEWKGTGNAGADSALEQGQPLVVHMNEALEACNVEEAARMLEGVAAEEATDVSSFPSQQTHQGEVARTSPCHLARRA
jgi:hypothetical protein